MRYRSLYTRSGAAQAPHRAVGAAVAESAGNLTGPTPRGGQSRPLTGRGAALASVRILKVGLLTMRLLHTLCAGAHHAGTGRHHGGAPAQKDWIGRQAAAPLKRATSSSPLQHMHAP